MTLISELLSCAEGVAEARGGKTFQLSDLYAFEHRFVQAWPTNADIRGTIRRRVCDLRDQGEIEMLGAGQYRLVG